MAMNPYRRVGTTGVGGMLPAAPQAPRGLLGNPSVIGGLLTGIGGGLANYGSPNGISQGYNQAMQGYNEQQWAQQEWERQQEIDAREAEKYQTEKAEAAAETAEKARIVEEMTGLLNQVNLPPDMKNVAMGLLKADPVAAYKMVGELMKPQEPEAPKTVGGMFWDEATQSYKPIPGYTEQAAAIAAAGRAPATPQQAPAIDLISLTGPDGKTVSVSNRDENAINELLAQGYAEANNGQGGNFGLNPIFATDNTGKLRAYQPNKDGGVREIELPKGFNFAPPVTYLDTGTSNVPMSSRTGLPVPGAAPVPKDVAGEARAKEEGAATGKAVANLPKARDAAKLALKTISDIRNDPGKKLGTGWASFGNIVPASPGFDFQQLVDQAIGQTFLIAYETLKGGGQITVIEGEKATQAMFRMKTAQSEEAFDHALEDFEAVVMTGYARAYEQAKQTPPDDLATPSDDGYTIEEQP